MSNKSHWEKIYSTKKQNELSWTQTSATLSLELIQKTGLGPGSKMIDVGGGTSVLPKNLLERNFSNLTVVDFSAEALSTAKRQLGELGTKFTWLEGDITTIPLPTTEFDLWHDRAVFHFLTEKEKRSQYVAQAYQSLKPGGFLIIATFALEGPEKCSGLEVVRYSSASLQSALGGQFQLRESRSETHTTPWKTSQEFLYCLFQKVG